MLRSILSGIVLLLLASCGDPCSNEVHAESLSSDKSLNAIWFVRDCGATTDFSTIVSVSRVGEPYKKEEYLAFVAKGRQKLRLVWEGSDRLAIECIGCERRDIFKQVTVIGKVQISYLMNE